MDTPIRGWRLVPILLAYYIGVFAGNMVFMRMHHNMDPLFGQVRLIDIPLAIAYPFAVLGVGLVVPRASILVIMIGVLSVLLPIKKWPIALASLLAVGCAVVEYLVMSAWSVG